jgi:hypothetical protein
MDVMEQCSQFFRKEKDGSVTFIGEKLEVRVPQSYEKHGGIRFGETEVSILAIFDMKFNDTLEVGFYNPALIVCQPSDIKNVTENEEHYTVLTFYTEDVFMKSTKVVKNGKLAYVIFTEFIDLGNRLPWMTYDSMAFIFDRASKTTGINFRVDHSVLEFVVSHLTRSRKDPNLPYRLTSMKDEPVTLALRYSQHSAISTMAKSIGAYFNEGVDSALVNQSDMKSTIEDVVRR